MKITNVTPIDFPYRVPEGVVLRVKFPAGDDRFWLQVIPMNAIGRLERDEAASARGHRLVEFVGRAVRIRILERHEIIEVRCVPKNIIVLRAIEVEQTEVGTGPMPTIFALSIAHHRISSLGLPRIIPQPQAVGTRQLHAHVIHPDNLSITKDCLKITATTLPGLVPDHHNFPRGRLVQLKFQPGLPGDEMIVNEQLAPATDIDDLHRWHGGGAARRDARKQKRQGEQDRRQGWRIFHG